jgi:AraC-like DNA-binding protein
MSNETFSAIRASREPGSSAKAIDWRIESIVQHLQTQRHLEPGKAISRLADSVNLSPSRLRHLFKAETGKGLKKYLIEARMEMGRELLEKTSLSVKEIAAKLGYSHVSHFDRDFKRSYRCSPGQYKKERSGTRERPACSHIW